MESFLLLAQEDVWWAAGGTFIFVVLLGVAALVLWVWALIDVVQNPRIDGLMRIVWAIVIIFAPILGSLIYLTVGRNMSSTAQPG